MISEAFAPFLVSCGAFRKLTPSGGAVETVNQAQNGNLSDGSRAFTYDLENRLTSVSGSASMTAAADHGVERNDGFLVRR